MGGYEHAISVREEAIAFGDGVLVSAVHVMASGEGADQHQQRRSWQVEVRQQRADRAKLKSGIDEDTGLSAAGEHMACALLCGMLQGSHHRGAGGNYATAIVQRAAISPIVATSP